MANTYVDYTAVASQTDYNFSFEYLRDDHVKVKVNGTLVTNYTIVTSPTPTKIRFNTAPTAGAAIKIYRDSRGDFSPLVDFVNGSILTENELDESYKHNLFVSQEASEGQGGEQLTKKGLTHYDAEGNKIINLGTPTASTDAANKSYVDQTIDNSIALGGSPAIVSLGGYDVTALGSTRARTLANRFADVINVLDYGAYNDGTNATATTTAIQNALDTGNTVMFPKGTYSCDSSIVLTNKDVNIIGNNSTIEFSSGFLDIKGSKGSDFTLNSNATEGSNTVSVSGGSYVAGDLVQIVDDTDYSLSAHREAYVKGELLNVRSYSSPTITFEDYLRYDYTTGVNLKVREITPIKVLISNLNVKLSSANTSAYAVRVQYAKDSLIENCRFDDSGVDSSAAFIIDQSKNISFINSKFSCTTPYPSPSGSGTLYGLVISDSENIQVTSCYLYATRHGIGLGGSRNGGTKDINIRDCIITNQDSTTWPQSADIHGNCSGVTYESNTIYGGASIAGRNCKYIGNVIYGSNLNVSGMLALTEVVGGTFEIKGNILKPSSTQSSYIEVSSSAFLEDISENYSLDVCDNIIYCVATGSANTNILSIGTHGGNATVQPSVTFKNNRFEGDGADIVRVVRYAGISDGGYTNATGTFIIDDFELGVLPSTVKIFEVTAGIVDATAKIVLPTHRDSIGFTIAGVNPTFPRPDETSTYPFDYGTYKPSVVVTMDNRFDELDAGGTIVPLVDVRSTSSTNCVLTMVDTGDPTASPITFVGTTPFTFNSVITVGGIVNPS